MKVKSTLLFCLAVIFLLACASRKPHHNKIPKAGKPIPCPLKDCK